MATASPFKVWKTITLGTRHKTAEDFRAALQAAGCYITDSANAILDLPAFQAADQETEIDLVVASIAHLGLREKAGHHNICARARELGLELCPAEVGPQLRLQYLDQPSPYWLKIVMEPLQPAGHSPLIFSVDGTFRRSLDTRYAYNVRYSSEHFVFVKPR